MDIPKIIAELASLILSVATLVQVLKARADVSDNTARTVTAATDAKNAATEAKTAAATTADTLGAVNGHGTAMEALGETMAKQDQLAELIEYTHKSVHELRNAITPLAPLAPMVLQLWKAAGNPEPPPAAPEPPPAADEPKGT